MTTTISRRGMLAASGGAATALATGFRPRASWAQDMILIGFSQATMNHPHRVAMAEVNRRYAEENYADATFVMTDANDQAEQQVADVESLMAQGISVLMISPVTAQALTPVVREVLDRGLPVVTMDRKVNVDATVHIGADNRLIGRAAGEYVRDRFGGDARIVELQGTAGASPTVDRGEGLREGLGEGAEEMIVATQVCDYRREPAQKFVEDVIQRFGPGEFNVVYAHNDEMALGAVQALEAAGRLEDVAVVGIDGQEEAYQAIKDGRMAATFVYSYLAPDAVQVAYQLAKGETLPPVITVESPTVTADNIDEFLGTGF